MANTTYKQQLWSDDWKIKRKEILERDLHTCRNCGSKESLHVHHRQYHMTREDMQLVNCWEYDNKYLITLCEPCHSAGHEQYKIQYFTL